MKLIDLKKTMLRHYNIKSDAFIKFSAEFSTQWEDDNYIVDNERVRYWLKNIYRNIDYDIYGQRIYHIYHPSYPTLS